VTSTGGNGKEKNEKQKQERVNGHARSSSTFGSEFVSCAMHSLGHDSDGHTYFPLGTAVCAAFLARWTLVIVVAVLQERRESA